VRPLPTLGSPGAQRERALYQPRHVALVSDGSPVGEVVARNLARGGFSGQLFGVGVVADGLHPVPSVTALPLAPDLSVLAVAPERLAGVMTELGQRGGLAAVVPGAAPDLPALVAGSGVRALGQGSFGICVPALGLNASVAHLAPRRGRLALVCQSAGLTRAVMDWAEAEAVGFSHVIGIGGNGDLGFAHALDWLSRDPGTAAILLDIRRIKNRRMFISAARAAARMRPVVAIRAGGLADDPSGTADAVMEAALRRAGVLQVRGLDDLLSAAETLARVKLPRGAGAGGRVAVVANALGLGRLGADAVLAGGARLAEPPAEARASLAIALGGWDGRFPLTVPAEAGTRLGEAAAMLAAMPGVDVVIAAHAPAAGEDPGAAAAALQAAAKASRGAPVLACWAGQATAGSQRAALAAAGVAVFATPEAAVRGALHLLADRRNRLAAAELPGREVVAVRPDRDAVARLFAAVRAEGRRDLTEDEALSVLAAYGVPVVPGRVAATPQAAAAAAVSLGFPVVLKLRSPDVSHKTELGGVAMGLRGGAVRAAAAAMEARFRELRPAARFGGFLVQRQVTGAEELRMELRDDPMFGPYLRFGLGGTAADLLGDAGYDLPPLNQALAAGLVRRTRAARLLRGWRDHPAADADAVEGALVRLAGLAVDFPEIESVRVNPLFASAAGVLAADAGLTLRPDGEAGLLAIPPYPEEWVEHWTSRAGETVTIRPIRPEDAEALGEGFRALTPEDVRWRFFSQIRELPPEQVARLTQIDYDREMAFVAVQPGPAGREILLGVARLIREGGGESGEFAVVVGGPAKGQGLGRHLMERLFDWARAAGMRRVQGQVLADNAAMLAFVRALGFRTRRNPEDEEVYEVEREV
jgi:acetyltransferase